MNKKVLVTIGVIVGFLIIGGGALAYTINQNSKNEQDKMAMEKSTEDEVMMKKEEDASMEKETMEKTDEIMTKDESMSKHGSYVVLADYNSDPAKFADSKKVYFFHASWCPICQGIDKEISADTTKIPAGITLVKTDFDSSTDLRQKYGVTTQYTFVQVDNAGNETSQWSATSLEKALANIES